MSQTNPPIPTNHNNPISHIGKSPRFGGGAKTPRSPAVFLDFRILKSIGTEAAMPTIAKLKDFPMPQLIQKSSPLNSPTPRTSKPGFHWWSISNRYRICGFKTNCVAIAAINSVMTIGNGQHEPKEHLSEVGSESENACGCEAFNTLCKIYPRDFQYLNRLAHHDPGERRHADIEESPYKSCHRADREDAPSPGLFFSSCFCECGCSLCSNGCHWIGEAFKGPLSAGTRCIVH